MFDPTGVILDPKLLDLARVLSRRRKTGKAGRQKSLVVNPVRAPAGDEGEGDLRLLNDRRLLSLLAEWRQAA